MEQVQEHREQEHREIVSNQQFGLCSFSEAVQRYEQAKARLLAVQDETMKATAELMASRAALSPYLEAIWPGQQE